MKIAALIAGQLFTLAVASSLALAALGPAGWIPVVLLWAIYTWGLYTYFHYRAIRQEELLHLMSTAAEADSPIGAAVWAYLSDRPRRWGFERKVEQLALLLESGESLAAALRATPGLVPRETVLAAAVGEPSGQLALCLRHVPRWRLATAWLEALPRFIYPLLLLLFISGCLLFITFFITPRFEKIFHDFHLSLPEATQNVMWFARSFPGSGGMWMLLLLIASLIALLVASPTTRWYCPGVGRFSRMQVQSRVLSILGILLETERPLPEALDLLADADYFAGTARRRLIRARQHIEQGESLAPCLHQQGLLPAPMVALVQAAERTRNLPWALTELGAHLAERQARAVRRVSMMFFPVAVMGVGALVAYLAVAWFLPLIKLLTELA
jgi:type II secretory pathway component PulF